MIRLDFFIGFIGCKSCKGLDWNIGSMLKRIKGKLLIMHYSISYCYLPYNYGHCKPTYNNACIICSFLQNEPNCPGYPTERYTVDIDGVQVVNMTAIHFQSLTTNHTNGSVTLSLPQTQRLSEEAVTVNMTKFNTVPTNMSDDMGDIVTEMVTWGTSAVFSELELTRVFIKL